MFGTYLKGSLWVLPWLLIPVACFILFVLGIDPYYIELYGFAEKVVGNSWSRFAFESALFSLILSLAAHIVLLLIVPCAIGGADPNIKHFQFFIGFFANLALSLIVPVYYFLSFGLDNVTFGILIGMHFLMFLAVFIIGSRFVSPVFKRAFWFTYYG
jgi:hypothetical protein